MKSMYATMLKKDRNYAQEVIDAKKATELLQTEFEEYKEKHKHDCDEKEK